jgi:hypothetical protein
MPPRSRYLNCLFIALVSLLIIFTFSCGQEEKYAGKYLARGEESLEHREAYIELKEGGQGVWARLDDEVSFTWYMKGNELRLNTKLGGVVVGKIKDDTNVITLPGERMMTFKRVR